MSALMHAIRRHVYGDVEALRLETVERPVPGEREVLVRVRAASVNPLDWHFMTGTPYALRIASGVSVPKDPRLGADVAGVVVAVGQAVSAFEPGDAVFGTCRGAFAEFACVADTTLVKKPANIGFDSAAAVPVAAVTALQGLRDIGRVVSGARVLINGASGGVGTCAVQIAKAWGAHVTAVCSVRNLALVQRLGADRVIDYAAEDFTADDGRYDVLLDCVGNRTLAACRRTLVPGGRHVIVGGPKGAWLEPMPRVLAAALRSAVSARKSRMLLAKVRQDDLVTLAGMLESGRLVPAIGARFPLHQVPEAIRLLGTGHASGKIVIEMRD